jgi:hypothetical protein
MKKDIIYYTILDSTKLMSTNVSPRDKNLPFQLLKHFCGRSSTSFHLALDNVSESPST